ncbi:MAG: hypothetical protein R3D55_18915 [Chloroflexota bacterium]
MVLLFALRCLVPLALVMGIGYAMNWMVNRWEAEAAAEKVAVAGTAVATQKEDHCWAFKQCDEELRKDCPGFKEQMAPCWLVRTRVEGHLPDECIACPLYKQTPSFA